MSMPDLSRLVVSNSNSSAAPTVTMYRATKSCGQSLRIDSFGSSRNVMLLRSSPDRSVDSTAHSFTRAKPCIGSFGSEAFAPNHGQQIGTPPRIALSGLNALAELIQRTDCWPFG